MNKNNIYTQKHTFSAEQLDCVSNNQILTKVVCTHDTTAKLSNSHVT